MTEDERRTKRLLFRSVKKLDDAYKHCGHEETKTLFTKDLADIIVCILAIGESERLDLETEVCNCIKRKTKRQEGLK